MVTKKKIFFKEQETICEEMRYNCILCLAPDMFLKERKKKKKQNTKLVSKLHEVMCWEVLFYPHPL